MDGRGRALDNIFVERLWRSVKYEDVYLKGYASLPELLLGLTEYFAFYNGERPHQSLGNRTPDVVYHSGEGGGASIVDRFGGSPDGNGTRALREARPCGGGLSVLGPVPADSVWTKRECRRATVWTSRGQRAFGARCPHLAHTHSPFAHTAPHQRRCGLRTPAAQQQQVFYLNWVGPPPVGGDPLNLGQRQTAAIEEGGPA